VGHNQHTIAIFAPVVSLTVTVESRDENGSAEIHLHPGGQGFWIARMLRQLGQRPLLCGPIGGETGKVIRGLLPLWEIDLSPIETDLPSPTTIQDRRSGERELVAETPPLSLDRHSADEFYGTFLDHAIAAGLAVIAGQVGEILQLGVYRRLSHDLRSTAVKVVGDLHGPELMSFLEGGPLDILKVSEEDLKADGLLADEGDPSGLEAIHRLTEAGSTNVVLSRGERSVLASIDGKTYEAVPPTLQPADFRGAGDSMTAGLAASLQTGVGPEETLRLACGAGAANVTRQGLGSASRDLFQRLADQVVVTEIPSTAIYDST
jgi:1-phosphofructokinase